MQNNKKIVGVIGRFQLEEHIGARVDIQRHTGLIRGLTHSADTSSLLVNRIQAGFADDLVFEIHADRPRRDRLRGRMADGIGATAVAALHVERHRQIDAGDDAPQVSDGQFEWKLFAIRVAVRDGYCPTAGRDDFRAGLGQGLRAARIPAVEQDDRIAFNVERRELPRLFDLCRHYAVTCLS